MGEAYGSVSHERRLTPPETSSAESSPDTKARTGGAGRAWETSALSLQRRFAGCDASQTPLASHVPIESQANQSIVK